MSGVSFSTVSALCGAWVGVDYMRERGVIGDAASSVAASWNDFIQVREREREREIEEGCGQGRGRMVRQKQG